MTLVEGKTYVVWGFAGDCMMPGGIAFEGEATVLSDNKIHIKGVWGDGDEVNQVFNLQLFGEPHIYKEADVRKFDGVRCQAIVVPSRSFAAAFDYYHIVV